MSDEEDFKFFEMRKEGKTYISRVFSYDAHSTERRRQVRIVLEGSDKLHLGEIEGAMCLRLTGKTRKTQITAYVSQDDKQIKRVTLQSFKNRAGDWIQSVEKDEFTFRSDEFERLVCFLKQIEFINLSNEQNFQIEDISTQAGKKSIVDASDSAIIKQFKEMEAGEREQIIRALQGALTSEEINILLGRRKGLEEFEKHICLGDWAEPEWQDFFDRQQWVFGYGLDYRIMRQFDREMAVGSGGSDNQNKPFVDFLMNFTDYTVLVEIKRPDTPIFRSSRGGRAGTWEFSPDFLSAVSQVIEQKARWLSFAQVGDHFNKTGTRKIEARTRNAKTVLVVGLRSEFSRADDERAAQIKHDTFELFRRENRTIEIVTFDELLERAQFITRDE
uniref:Shedu immune nuclease family protein n=1 Tax=Pararhizobium sp. IMCC3301 TaxID=3067904 RepID=UPI00274199C8|nr:Shedu immune nuclease family protein [Pararhizobium sp. IMCC3301]